MITADALARELGCTLADLDDLGVIAPNLMPDVLIYERAADQLRAAWSKRTGIDYTEAVK